MLGKHVFASVQGVIVNLENLLPYPCVGMQYCPGLLGEFSSMGILEHLVPKSPNEMYAKKVHAMRWNTPQLSSNGVPSSLPITR